MTTTNNIFYKSLKHLKNFYALIFKLVRKILLVLYIAYKVNSTYVTKAHNLPQKFAKTLYSFSDYCESVINLPFPIWKPPPVFKSLTPFKSSVLTPFKPSIQSWWIMSFFWMREQKPIKQHNSTFSSCSSTTFAFYSNNLSKMLQPVAIRILKRSLCFFRIRIKGIWLKISHPSLPPKRNSRLWSEVSYPQTQSSAPAWLEHGLLANDMDSALQWIVHYPLWYQTSPDGSLSSLEDFTFYVMVWLLRACLHESNLGKPRQPGSCNQAISRYMEAKFQTRVVLSKKILHFCTPTLGRLSYSPGWNGKAGIFVPFDS